MFIHLAKIPIFSNSIPLSIVIVFTCNPLSFIIFFSSELIVCGDLLCIILANPILVFLSVKVKTLLYPFALFPKTKSASQCPNSSLKSIDLGRVHIGKT
ncbi:Uncharacterised protein [Chlamydia abortus]|nr:hypothetical protein [Mycoplasmopsis arginini]CRH45500.1 Uncharacterised protein [Chlamydia trachomatis]SGA27003.1 Uncharacterised protein [Chlamydia abortus]MDI3350359.1 hypothetical protein [Mycoplasmopsis arginini]MDI3350979.1 hypothetical protein [Mycoplasmopsis arginini]